MGDLLPPEPIRSDERRLIIAISGLPGSGKSTLARALVDDLGGCLLSFGDYVRAIAVKTCKSADRKSLQDLGEELVQSDSRRFVQDAISWSVPNAERLIVDGVRHVAVLDELRRYAQASNSHLIHVHLTVTTETRKRRIQSRPTPNHSTEFSEQHPVEADVQFALAKLADITLSDSTLASWVNRISAYSQHLPLRP